MGSKGVAGENTNLITLSILGLLVLCIKLQVFYNGCHISLLDMGGRTNLQNIMQNTGRMYSVVKRWIVFGNYL